MYNGDEIRILLTKQKKTQKELSLAITGKPNSSLHNLFKNPTAKTLEAIADFFDITIDSLFIRTRPRVDTDEADEDRKQEYLKRLLKYYDTQMSTYRLLNDTNDYLLQQLKHRVAELENRLQYIQNHPEAITELKPLPAFNLIVPYAQPVTEPEIFPVPTAEDQLRKKKRKKELRKLMKAEAMKTLHEEGIGE